jgi:hypothetical protein
METIPDQTSNAGPAEPERDWRDWLDEAREFARSASRAELDESFVNSPTASGHARRLRYIRKAMDALLEAEAMLCR